MGAKGSRQVSPGEQGVESAEASVAYRELESKFKELQAKYDKLAGCSGSAASASAPATASTTAPAAAPAAASVENSEAPLKRAATIRWKATATKAQPATTVQFRMHDGTRHQQRFNLSDTVASLYAFAASACPGVEFDLASAYPRKVLRSISCALTQS